MNSDFDEIDRVFAAAKRMKFRIETMEILAGDVSRRRYIRVNSGSGTRVACCYPEPFDASESASHRFRRLRNDNPRAHLIWASDPVSYMESTEWFGRIGIPVPEILGVHGDLGIIVLEDIGDVSLQTVIQTGTESEIESYYLTALSYINTLQESTDQVSHRDTLAGSLILDAEKLRDELELLLRGIRMYLPGELDEVYERELRAEWFELAENAAPRHPVLCHRDYHARNLYIRDDTLIVIDHQDFRLGHSCYDGASLLYDPYVYISYGRRDRFFNTIGSFSPGETAPVVIQRLLKATGTYITEINTRRNTEFFRSIVTATGDIRRLFDDELMDMMPRTGHLVSVIHEKTTQIMPH